MKWKPTETIATLGTAYVLLITAAVLIRDMLRERDRIAKVVADTAAVLDERTADVRAKVDKMVAGEHTARYDPALWDEPAETPR